MLRIGICVLFVSLYNTQPADGGIATKKDEYIPIKYPGPVKDDDTSNRYGLDDADEIPEQCRNQNFCTIKPKNYPQEEFNKMFSKQTPTTTLVIDDIVDRQGDPNDMDNCDITVTYEPLYKVRNHRGWHTVVQAPEKNYVQMVRLETCVNTGAACFTVFPTFAEITTSCVQKYSVWEFLVTADNGTERIQAELPVCCSCQYRINKI